jgi:transposase
VSVCEWEIDNRTDPITSTLRTLLERARAAGISSVRIVVEPTGIYHKRLLDIAASLGMQTAFVNASHVVKMREVVFGDDGKTDQRDPYAIEAVVAQGRLIADRRHQEVYHLLRQWGKLYHDAELSLIDAKSRIHRALRLLFPDFDFSTDFLYSASGAAIMRCFALDPHRIATFSEARIYERLRKHSNIRRSSVTRLLTQARQTVVAIGRSRVTDVHAGELALAWEDFELATRRRDHARRELESLYDEARIVDRHLPDPTGSGVSKVAMARLIGEAGPLSDYRSWRQLLRMGGVNLRERKSGKWIGQTRITRAGRPVFRAIINQMALALVRRDRLYGPYYQHKTGVQKMPGNKAMTAVARKIVKMIWGWYRSGQAFDQGRVFTCAGEHRRAA